MTRSEANRLIAEKLEGWTFEIKGMLDEQAVEAGYGRPPQPAQYGIMTHPDYFTDIAACVRAAEAWRKQMAHKGERYWIFESGLVPEDRPSVRLYWDSGKSMQMSFGDTLEEAMAYALVGAVK